MNDWKKISRLPSLCKLNLVDISNYGSAKVFEYVNRVRSMRYRKVTRSNFGRIETSYYSKSY